MSWNFDPKAQQWCYVLNKQQAGPTSYTELAALFAKGKPAGGIGPETHVWCGEMPEWKANQLQAKRMMELANTKYFCEWWLAV